jgi:endonuclease YncB( thermonuclease family)
VTVIVRETDRYGRLVGEVFLPDRRSLNQELGRAGLVWWYRQSKSSTAVFCVQRALQDVHAEVAGSEIDEGKEGKGIEGDGWEV